VVAGWISPVCETLSPDSAPFVAVWQNVPDALGFEPIYRVLDEMIKNWH